MSVRVMSWVWSNSKADPTDRLVLLAIADCANDAGTDAYPSMAALVAKTGLHERSVQRALGRLSEAGELVVAKNAGPRGCNRYQVTMTPGTAPPPAQRRGGRETPRRQDTPAQSRRTPAQRHPTPGTAPGDTPAQRHPEPSFNHQLTVREPSGSQAIVAEWIGRCRTRPPRSVVGQMARQIDALLGEGFDADDVRRAIAHWMTKDLAPSVLPSIVNSITNGTPRASPNGSTADIRVAAGFSVSDQLRQEGL